MRSILRFAAVLAVVAVAPSMAQGQSGKVTIKGGIVAKQPSDCDAFCQLEGKVNELTKRLDAAEKENTRLKGALAEDEKGNYLKISALENAIAVLQADVSVNQVTVKSTLDAVQSTTSARLLNLEATANEYKTHTHTLPKIFGITKQGNFLMVTLNTGPKDYDRPTSGPQAH